MELTLPTTTEGWLPFSAAAFTLFIGLVALFAPRIMLRLFRLQAREGYPQAIGEPRSTMAGFWLGVGLMGVMMFDQPFVQLCLGAGWLMSAFGRLVSILSDSGATALNLLILLVMLVQAGLTLLPAFGMIG